MSDKKEIQKDSQKVILAIGFNGSKLPDKARDLLGGKGVKITVFPTFKSISGCKSFAAANIPAFTGPKGQLYNPATAKDADGKLIISEWRKDGDLIIGEI